MPHVFLSIPVQGHRLPQTIYDAIIRGAQEAGLSIVNPEVNKPPTPAQLSTVSPDVVHAHNRALLDTASLVIAEVSQPSLGVGYELAIAQARGLRILALCDAALLPGVSLMIRGLAYERFKLTSYGHSNEIASIIGAFVWHNLSTASPGRASIAAATVEHFDGLAAVYDESTEWRQNEELLHWLSSRLTGRTVCLDVGTGTGLVGACIRRNGSIVVGLDRSEEMLRRAAARLDWAVQGAATSLPFTAATFDGAALRSVLQYLDDVRCLKEVRRVMRREGMLVCAQATGADIGAAAWWERLKRWTQPLRQRFYTASILEQRFMLAGFEVVEIESARIARREPWEGVLRHCPAAHHDTVRAMIRDAPTVVRDGARMQVSADGISYEQHWTLLAATPVASAESPTSCESF